MSRVRVAIAWVAALSVVLLIGNFLARGVDVPNGLLYLLSLIISAVFAPEAVQAFGSFNKNRPATPVTPVVSGAPDTQLSGQQKESDS